MGPIQAIKICFVKYIDFRGRASRPEFWWFLLFTAAAALTITIISSVFFGLSLDAKVRPVTIFNLLTALPLAAVFTRRLRDVGCRAWQHIVFWLFIPLSLITDFMLSDALPEWATMTYALSVLIWGVLYFFVLAQLFRKSKPGAVEKDEDEAHGFVPELYVPSAHPNHIYANQY